MASALTLQQRMSRKLQSEYREENERNSSLNKLVDQLAEYEKQVELQFNELENNVQSKLSKRGSQIIAYQNQKQLLDQTDETE